MGIIAMIDSRATREHITLTVWELPKTRLHRALYFPSAAEGDTPSPKRRSWASRILSIKRSAPLPLPPSEASAFLETKLLGSLRRQVSREPLRENQASTKEKRRETSIILERGNTGFGFTIKAGNQPGSVRVGKITPHGAADRDGRLEPGARILAINECDTSSITREEAVELIQNAGYILKLDLE